MSRRNALKTPVQSLACSAVIGQRQAVLLKLREELRVLRRRGEREVAVDLCHPSTKLLRCRIGLYQLPHPRSRVIVFRISTIR